MCGAARYVGQINATDFFTRLMASLAYTGIAPTSFYGPGVREKHFDGMCVPFMGHVQLDTCCSHADLR